MKKTILTMFITGDTPPDLGFNIVWYDDYTMALSSIDDYSGYFKPEISGGKGNIMVLSELSLPITELDISNTGAIGSVWGGKATEIRVGENPLLEGVSSDSILTIIQANNTNLNELPFPSQIADGALIRVDNNGLDQDKVDAMFYDVVNENKYNLTIENNGNADINLEQTIAIENLGGKIWENNSGICKFQTKADTTISFIFFINAGADVDWYVDGIVHTENSNNATFDFTDNSIKTIEIRGTDVSQGRWLVSNNKSLVGTFDISSMIDASSRIDFSDNPDLTKVILPNTKGIFDQLMGFNSGISELRLDKLPGLINSNNVQIRLGNCPNLNTDSVANNILLIDNTTSTGRQFWTNGTTTNLDPAIKTLLLNNNWTVVE